MDEVVQQTAQVTGGRMGPAPRRTQVTPVGAVPVPVRVLVHLALHGIGDLPPAQPQRRLRHAQPLEQLRAQELAQGTARNPLHDLSGQQQAHALILHLGPGSEQQRRAAGARHEILERRVPLAQVFVGRQHVRQAGGVRQQVAHQHPAPLAALKLWNELLDRILERELASICQNHHRRSSHRLGDRSQKEHGPRALRRAEGLVDHLAAALDVQCRGRHLARLHLGADKLHRLVEPLLAERQCDAAEKQRSSCHHGGIIVPPGALRGPAASP